MYHNKFPPKAAILSYSKFCMRSVSVSSGRIGPSQYVELQIVCEMHVQLVTQ